MKRIVLLVIMGLIVSFEGFSFPMPKGHLIYTVSNDTIYDLNLETLKETELYKENNRFITYIAKISNSQFLFVSYEVGKGEFICKFDRNNHVVNRLMIEGRAPIYIPRVKNILFYNTPSYGEGHWIHVFNRNMAKPKKLFKGGRMIQVSSEEIIFTNPSNKDQWLLYNVATKTLGKLPIEYKNCYMFELWPGKTRQLLCYNEKRKQNFFTDLDGKYKQYISVNFTETEYPFLYLSLTDQLLFTKGYTDFTGEHYDLWVYDFKVEKKKRLFKDSGGIMPGRAIYCQD